MVDVFDHSTRLDTAAVEERRDLVQIIPDGGKLPCDGFNFCLLYTSPSPRDYAASRMPSSA